MSSTAVRLRLAAPAAFLLAAAAVLVPLAQPSRAAAASADWQLQNNRTSTVAGAPALTDIGTGNAFASTAVDGVAGRRVLSFPKGNGLQATPTTGLTAGSAYTVVVLYRPTALPGWQRILDFNNGAGDLGLYQNGGNLIPYPLAGSSNAPISATTFNQVVFTRTTGKLVTGYVNGVQAFQFADTTDLWRLAGPDLRFFKDNTTTGTTGEEGAGQVARLRVFSTALTKAEVTALDRLPATTADLSVKLVDAPDPVLHGNLLAYTASVLNAGPAAAATSKAVFTLPTGTTVVGSSPSVGTCAAPVGLTVTCTLGTLAPSATATVLVVVTAPAATGSITGKVVVSTTTPDPAAANNTATTTTTVR